MKKIAVILISGVLIISCGALVYYGLRHARGIPVAIQKIERPVLQVKFIDKEIDLTQDTGEDIWNTISPCEVKLTYQVTALPWPKAVTPKITVKAFHNQKNIYFYINWMDETHDVDLSTNKFSDACAIMFPLGEEIQPATIMMGFLGKTNIWQWKASQDKEYWLKESPTTNAYADFYYPFEEKELLPVSMVVPKSAVNDLVTIRVGTITPKQVQNVQGRGFWQSGDWKVVFKRSIEVSDPQLDASFIPDKKLCAFAVWNGSRGERGGRKSISDWVELKFQ